MNVKPHQELKELKAWKESALQAMRMQDVAFERLRKSASIEVLGMESLGSRCRLR